MCITVDGKLAAAALSIMVQYELFGDQHTYDEITGNGTFNTHSNNGNVLYGIEVFVHPEFRSLRLDADCMTPEKNCVRLKPEVNYYWRQDSKLSHAQ